ncbi:FAD-dependent oxidoreductase [Chryseobacterium sp. ERMR1:04]|uniref:FAD-dependent oxidoreductase n=1 Tax=Chryseobacterium sp. ERMR1:04 TaxID=1705393 RepID=UPI0006C8B707|nr:FAD-dependent oxidoreductase [Chryseobacterium sp. ERMR1:04]KPH15071.1 FAD-dependent oxidoreductase [Chryseobacterium sp. ERMR1:04]
MKTENYDVIVIGGGAIGLATAYHLGKRKANTLVLEQFTFVNQLGSSAGVSRQFRIPYPDDYMVQMALDAQPYWDELQKETDTPLLDKVGTLWFGDPNVHSTEGNIAEAEAALKALNVPYTNLTAREIEDQYHFRNLPANYIGLFQPDGASINFKATIETLLGLCKKEETVELKEDSPVLEIKQNGKLFEITTPNGIYIAKKLAIIPGPYINSVINLLDFKIDATYWNMSSAYFKKTDPTIQYPTWFVFQDPILENGNQFYGFPSVDWDHPEYIRVAPDFVINPLEEPSDRTLIPNPQELAYTSEWVKNHMTGLNTEPEYTSTCLIALSTIENKELLIDFAPKYVPNHKNIVLYATGWAAKFTPFLGKIMSDLALDGHTDFDISHFQLGRKFFKSM